jgi:hypothetical protein
LDGACGKIVNDFVTVSGFHTSESDNLRGHRNLGGIPAKATYVGPLDCSA